LASLSLPAFLNPETREFDYQELYRSTRIFIRALNRVIDINQYPLESARRSNFRHRPVGLGLQGLADVFCLMGVRFGSPESKVINRRIAETMYFGAMTESHALTQEMNMTVGAVVGPYPSIDENGGAPIRHGIFQFEMWKSDFEGTANPDGWKPDPDLGWDWETLRAKIMRDGVRNSLTIAAMPTASTSIIMGNVESFEPYYGMIYVRSTKSGEFYQICRPLVDELIRRKLWQVETNPATGKTYIPLKDRIMAENGSIQNILEIPEDIRKVFVCITDIKLKDLTEMARDRGIFTDQSMSLNVHFKTKDNMMADILKYTMFAWKMGLKTISYYTRTIQQLAALNFTGNSVKDSVKDTVKDAVKDSVKDDCLVCSA
jgi:ribonucleotide reductase alpha subunit